MGEDLVPLVCASVSHAAEHPDRIRKLGELTFASYLEGLREAGWHGDRRLARLGYAAGAIRYSLLLFSLAVAIEPGLLLPVERAYGPLAEIVDRQAHLLQYTLDLADEARHSIDDSSFPWPT